MWFLRVEESWFDSRSPQYLECIKNCVFSFSFFCRYLVWLLPRNASTINSRFLGGLPSFHVCWTMLCHKIFPLIPGVWPDAISPQIFLMLSRRNFTANTSVCFYFKTDTSDASLTLPAHSWQFRYFLSSLLHVYTFVSLLTCANHHTSAQGDAESPWSYE